MFNGGKIRSTGFGSLSRRERSFDLHDPSRNSSQVRTVVQYTETVQLYRTSTQCLCERDEHHPWIEVQESSGEKV